MMTIMEDVSFYLGVPTNEIAFDIELEMCIAGAIDDIRAVGVEIAEFDDKSDWTIFPEASQFSVSLLNQIKQYIYLTTKILFDPPLPSIILALERRQQQLLFYIQAFYDKRGEE